MFQKIENARSSPTHCAFCQSSVGPFVETGVDLLGHGLVLICTRGGDGQSGCAEQIGRIGGHMIDADEHQAKLIELNDLLTLSRATNDDLLGQLKKAQALSPETILELVDTRMRETAKELLATMKQPAKKT